MGFRISAALLAALALGLGSCSSGASTQPTCNLLAGDLVISEILADPAGADEGQEWFEIYNAAATEVHLGGLTLELTSGRGAKKHLIRGATAPVIPPRGYLALGDGVTTSGLLGYSYGDALGSMPNESGSLALLCGTREIDRVDYGLGAAGPGAPASGKTMQLTGAAAPEYHQNDSPDAWCDAVAPYGDGLNLGTPGQPNDPCAASGCDDGAGGFRPLRAPAPGDLVVTEILSNTPGTEAIDREWIEVYVAAATAVDLRDMEVLYGETCQSATPLLGVGCLTADAGSYVVLAASADPALNGGLAPPLATFGGSGLRNDAGCVGLRRTGDQVVLDQVTYGTSTDGAAFSLDPGHVSPTENDDPASWCAAEAAYGDGTGRGTPGAPNPPCPGSGCDDGAGGFRPVRLPAVGEVVITEVFCNTLGAEAANREWVEVTNTAAVPVDLLGVELRYGATCQTATPLAGTGCLTLAPGAHAVLGRSADSAQNGGLPTPLATFGGGGLLNDNGCLAVQVTSGALEIDRVTYGTSTDGRAFALDPAHETAADNDLAASWCVAQATFGDGQGRGTPGQANPACGGTGQCDDGAGGLRPLRPPAAGEVIITEIFNNTLGTEDVNREWIEVKNTAAESVDLLGVELRRGATCQTATPLDGTGCLTLAPGAYAVLAHSANSALNGGLPIPLATFGGSGLLNDGGCLAVQVTSGALEIDRVTYGTSTDGRAFALDPAHETATDNDASANWCIAQTTFGDGQGRGTPGLANAACP